MLGKQLFTFALILIIQLVHAIIVSKDNGLGIVPPMGWSTWNTFACEIDEDSVKEMADKIVELGLDQLGYKYVNLDDCWQDSVRTEKGGHMQVDEHFPSGMKAMGDYLHRKGLLFGIYSTAGSHSCEVRAGSLGHEETDANDFAMWGVDMLKYDNCHGDGRSAPERYTKMEQALNKTGRKIFFAIDNWGEENAETWAPKIGNSWRTSVDIRDDWTHMKNNFNTNQKFQKVAGPGGWANPDMLEVGMGKKSDKSIWKPDKVYKNLNLYEQQTHFALWAISKAPLMIGADLRSIKKESLDILKNKYLIAANQDPKSEHAICISPLECTGQVSAYMTTMSDGAKVIVITNWGEDEYKEYNLNLMNLGLTLQKGDKAVVTDLFLDQVLSELKQDHEPVFINNLQPHQSRALKVKVQS